MTKMENIERMILQVPKSLENEVKKWDKRLNFYSKAGTARFIITIGLLNKSTFRNYVIDKNEEWTCSLAVPKALREDISKFQHENYLRNIKTTHSQLLMHGINVLEFMFR